MTVENRSCASKFDAENNFSPTKEDELRNPEIDLAHPHIEPKNRTNSGAQVDSLPSEWRLYSLGACVAVRRQ